MGGVGCGGGWIRGSVRTIGDNIGRVDGGISEDWVGIGGGKFELGGDEGEVSCQKCMSEDS